ncbi:DUF1574 family protein [Bizionia sp.]|uniref:DUF1574 family protein n=1 Tax=Bizionia sp. TaxID=1954480 RepID=UPI003A94DDF6
MIKRFLKHILWFLIPVFGVYLAVELFYRTVPNNYTVKYHLIESQKNNAEVIIFGDSHTFYGINPNYIDKTTVNLANVSQTIYFDKLLFDKYANQASNLKFVIFSLEYSSLSQLDNTQEDVWRKYFYANQMHLDVPLIKPYDIKNYSLALTQKLGQTARYFKDYIKNNTLVGSDKMGWGNTYIQAINSTELMRLAPIIAKKHDDNTSDFSTSISRIKEIIKTCESKNINVILVNMPVSNPYLQLLNQQEVKAITEITRQFAKKNTHVTAINLLGDKRFEIKHFHDADHLNAQGAQICSEILNNIIKKNYALRCTTS